MTSKERLLTALKGKRPDKVPVTLFIQSQGHFVTQLNPQTDPWDFDALQKSIIDYQRSLGLDVHVRMLFFNPHEPVFAHWDLLNFQNQTANWQIKTTETKEGNTIKQHHEITTPEGKLSQTFCINEERPGIFMYGNTEPPIKTEEDLRLAMKYEPPYSDETRQKMKESVASIKSYLGDDGIISSWANGGLFNDLAGIIDQTELYSLFLEDEDFYEALMEFAKKRVYDYTDAVLASGVDAICVRGNAAGGFVGNNCFHEYIMPYEREYLKYVQRNGVPAIYHNCGKIMELLPSYLELGSMNIEPWSPSPLGNADLDKLHEVLTNEFSVTSGVDQVNILQKGTVEQVHEATLKAIEKGKKFPAFIMQNVDFLEFGTPLENVEEYAKTALANREY
ncbi:MAG: uroporphyrinogen decarboxylase family protein [Lachnospiraceae bacterium]